MKLSGAILCVEPLPKAVQEAKAPLVSLSCVDPSLPCVTCDWRTGDDRGDGTRRHDNGSYRHRSQIHNHPMKHPWWGGDHQNEDNFTAYQSKAQQRFSMKHDSIQFVTIPHHSMLAVGDMEITTDQPGEGSKRPLGKHLGNTTQTSLLSQHKLKLNCVFVFSINTVCLNYQYLQE